MQEFKDEDFFVEETEDSVIEDDNDDLDPQDAAFLRGYEEADDIDGLYESDGLEEE